MPWGAGYRPSPDLSTPPPMVEKATGFAGVVKSVPTSFKWVAALPSVPVGDA